MYRRPHFQVLKKRLIEPRQFIQVISGPRQVGKTTLILQVLEELEIPGHFSSADEAAPDNKAWIDQQWETARLKMKQAEANEFLLVLDEIQKVNNWSLVVKKNWDRDSRESINLKVVLLGSSLLLMEQGLTESLAGRFERIYMGHWSFGEMKNAFGLEADEYVWFGGYPGAIRLKEEEKRWKEYILNSLIETTISKDILQLTRIYKPALLRRLFEFTCLYSGKIFSFNKMLGQLVDAGNTTTLSHYLELLDSAGLAGGIQGYSGSLVRIKATSPKLLVYNTAFLSAFRAETFQELRLKPDIWGQHVEVAVGAHLANAAKKSNLKLFYWRQGHEEVDYVLQLGEKVIGIEVKSGASGYHSGMTAFQGKFHPEKVILLGEGGLPWEEFLLMDPESLFR